MRHTILPMDVALVDVAHARPDFDARFSAQGKVYRYTYLEERWREQGKVRSRSTILSSAHPSVKAGSFKASEAGRKLATEQYRDVLREKVAGIRHLAREPGTS